MLLFGMLCCQLALLIVICTSASGLAAALQKLHFPSLLYVSLLADALLLYCFQDKADEFAAQVRQHYKALFEQYCKKYTNLTPQAESQLKLVCLAIATYRVLMPHLRDEAQLDAHLMETLGGLFTPFFMGSMKVSNWFRVAVLRQSPVTLATGTLENICQVGFRVGFRVTVQRLGLQGVVFVVCLTISWFPAFVCFLVLRNTCLTTH